MKRILYIILLLFVVVSCKKETTEVMDMTINPDDISKIELRADHYMLLPNGKAKMEFFPVVYVKKEVIGYNENGKKDTTVIENVVANDLIPKGIVKVVDGQGKELVDNVFSTADKSLAGTTINFKAHCRNIESEPLSITIRELPEENYDEVIIPIVFHVMLPPATTGITYNISSEYMQSVLDRINNIYNNRMTNDPNGGNAKIKFVLAKYTPKGLLMAEPGKNVIQLTEANMTTIGTGTNLSTGYDKFIVSQKSTCIWDPTKYLNIWLTKFRANSSTEETGSNYSYVAKAPLYMLPGYDLASIEGLTGMKTKATYGLSDIVTGESCLQSGILVNFMAFLSPQSQNETNRFSLAVPLGLYYGLFINDSPSDTSYPKTDPDYCDDTIIHSFYGSGNASVYKSNASYENRPANVPLRYFTSYNCMDVYTRGSSISVDQATRVRKVMKQCTNRQPIDPTYALTGKE